MTTARDIMHAGATCVGEHETLTAAAQHMRDLGVGAVADLRRRRPPARNDHRPRHRHQMCLPPARMPTMTTAGELAQGSAYHVSGERRYPRNAHCHGRASGAPAAFIDRGTTAWLASSARPISHGNLAEHEIAQFVKAICSPKALTP